MDDENHRKKSNAALKISLVVLGVLVLLGVIQAVTAGTVGVGALSFTLRETSSSTPIPTTTSEDAAGGLDGAVGAAPSSTEEEPPPSVDAKVVTGSWKQARGLLTVEVTKVENAGGRIKVFVTAINASTAKMDLPVASVSVVDDVQRDYGASVSTSRWPVTIPKNSSVNGFLELDRKAGADSTALSLTFSGIIGQLAPTGGAVTVTGIPIPR